MKRLLSIAELGRGDVEELFRLAGECKARTRTRASATPLAGRSLALVFEKPSLRTRVTFEVGMAQLGGTAVYLAGKDIGLGTRESIADVARNLGRWVDAIAARTYAQAAVEELARHAGVPVINALSDQEHPCQALADLYTLRERFGELRGRVLAFVGDGNNVYHSLALLGAMLGLEVRLAHPPDYGPNPRIVDQANAIAGATGARLVFGRDPTEVVRGADVVYTDAWTSMGQEAETEARRDAFAGYRVDDALLDAAGPSAVAMHCLPAHRGREITSAVMDGPRSIIWDQSENRLHVQKALLVEILRG